MLELGCLIDCERCLPPIKQFVAIGCEKSSGALRQQVQSGHTLGGSKSF